MDRLKDDVKKTNIRPEWASDRESWFNMMKNVNPTQETTESEKGENILPIIWWNMLWCSVVVGNKYVWLTDWLMNSTIKCVASCRLLYVVSSRLVCQMEKQVPESQYQWPILKIWLNQHSDQRHWRDHNLSGVQKSFALYKLGHHEMVFKPITHRVKFDYQVRSFLLASTNFLQLWFWSRDTAVVMRVSRDRTMVL